MAPILLIFICVHIYVSVCAGWNIAVWLFFIFFFCFVSVSVLWSRYTRTLNAHIGAQTDDRIHAWSHLNCAPMWVWVWVWVFANVYEHTHLHTHNYNDKPTCTIHAHCIHTHTRSDIVDRSLLWCGVVCRATAAAYCFVALNNHHRQPSYNYFFFSSSRRYRPF